MTQRTTTEHSEILLSVVRARGKVRGLPASEIEAISIFESIALALALHPRSVLYLALLARNQLARACTEELDHIENMLSAAEDLGNQEYAVSEVSSLVEARNSLLQLENLPRVDVGGSVYKKFSHAIDTFLEKSAARSVRRRGLTEMVRPSEEALSDLVSYYEELVKKHLEVNERMYALAVGVQNFGVAPRVSILGNTAASRARGDIENILLSLVDPAITLSMRDTVVRLLTDRAAVKIHGAPPSISDPKVSTTAKIPAGYELRARTVDTAASSTGLAGPYVMAGTGDASIQVGTTTLSTSNVLSPDVVDDIFDGIVGSAATWPVSVPAGSCLFLEHEVGGVTTAYKVPLNPTVSPATLSLSVLNTKIEAVIPHLHAAELGGSGTTGRVLLYSSTTSGELRVTPTHTETQLVGGNSLSVTLTNSAHSLLGFSNGAVSSGYPAQIIADCLNIEFGSIVVAEVTSDTAIKVSTLDESPTVSMTIVAHADLGLGGTFNSSSQFIELYGSTPTGTADPVDPRSFVDPGDVVQNTLGSFVVESVSSSKVKLTTASQGFQGDVTVLSAVREAYDAFNEPFQVFVEDWMKGSFSEELTKIDRAVAKARSSPTPARRNELVRALEELKTSLTELSTILNAVVTELPVGSAVEEKNCVDQIVATLTGRKYDKALDLLLSCQVYELLKLGHDTASYGGSVLNAMSRFVRQDVKFSNGTVVPATGTSDRTKT
jgi:hypothetical protein